MKKIIIGVGLFIAGFILPFVAIISALMLSERDTDFSGPGTREFTVEKPGKYYVWNRFYAVDDGKIYSVPEEMPSGATFVLTPSGSDQPLPFESDSSFSSSMGENKKKSIGFYEITQPGTYSLTVSGLEEKHLLSWGASLLGNVAAFVGGIFLLIFIVMAFCLGGVVMVILGIVDLARKSSKPSSPSQT